MLDKAEITRWESAYLDAAFSISPRRETDAALRAWARSMALIAEQFINSDDGDELEIVE